jgi:hypothetical protein
MKRSKARQTVGLAVVAGLSGAATTLLLAQLTAGIHSTAEAVFCVVCGAISSTPVGAFIGMIVRDFVPLRPGVTFLVAFLSSVVLGAVAGAGCVYLLVEEALSRLGGA